MADRGFLIKDELLARGASLVIPSFTKGKNQLQGKEVTASRRISNLRIHVERSIGRLKKFRILQTVWPLSQVKHADSIVTVCAAISNIMKPLLK